jgi:hypothetical protein
MGKQCDKCAHCGKKVPKFPFECEIDGVTHTVGADCIMDNAQVFIWEWVDQDTSNMPLHVKESKARFSLEKAIKREKAAVRALMDEQNSDK